MQLGNVWLTRFEHLLMAHWTTSTAAANHVVDGAARPHYLFTVEILTGKGSHLGEVLLREALYIIQIGKLPGEEQEH